LDSIQKIVTVHARQGNFTQRRQVAKSAKVLKNTQTVMTTENTLSKNTQTVNTDYFLPQKARTFTEKSRMEITKKDQNGFFFVFLTSSVFFRVFRG